MNKKTKSKRKWKNTSTNFSVIKLCKEELLKKGIKLIHGKNISLCTHKVIVDEFKKVFGYNPMISRNSVNMISDKIVKDNEYIYIIATECLSLCKIGYSNNPVKRLRTLQTGSPLPLMIYAVFNGNKDIEKKLHQRFSNLKKRGEWFKFKDSEIFDILSPLKNYLDTCEYTDAIDVVNNEVLFLNRQKHPNKYTKYLHIYQNDKSKLCKIEITNLPFGFIHSKLKKETTQKYTLLFTENISTNINIKKESMISKYKDCCHNGGNWYRYEGILKEDIENNKIIQL